MTFDDYGDKCWGGTHRHTTLAMVCAPGAGVGTPHALSWSPSYPWAGEHAKGLREIGI